MASIDDLFRKPNLPSNAGPAKRKLDVPDGAEAYKATKIVPGSDVKGRVNGSAPTVEEVADEDDDLEAGPGLPPDEEEEDGASDEEGRFFGGGVTSDARQAMNFLDDAETSFVEEKIDSAWARRLAGNLEKKISRNTEQRAKFEDDPNKFMQSEAELDADIKSLSLLTEHTRFYGDFTKAGGAEALVGCLAHDNTDIAINTIEIIAELLDEDNEVEQTEWDIMAAGLLNADLVNLLAQNFERFDEEDEADRQGVYHSLAVLEALGSQTTTAEKAGSEGVITYLLKRMRREETELTQNRQYSSEVLQVLLQDSALLRLRAAQLGAANVLLELLAQYRRRDPEIGGLEEEYASNLFNALVCIIREGDGKMKFLEEEGVELMLIMIREGKWSRAEALRTLDEASNGDGSVVCSKIVEAGGLKTLFGLFKKKPERQTIEHILDILAALLRRLPGESPERIRTLAKFAEKDYEKVSKLLEWRQILTLQLRKTDKEIGSERQGMPPEDIEDKEAEWDLRRLEAGLFALSTLDVVLAWLIAEDASAVSKIRDELSKQDSSPDVIKGSLRQQLSDVDTDADVDLAEMLQALIDAMP